MRKELNYFLVILSIFGFSLYFLVKLLNKYTHFTFEYFLEVCKTAASNFISSGVYYVGFLLIALTVIISLVLFAKTLLSFVKTKRRLQGFLEKQVNHFPKKLEEVLLKNEIAKEQIVLVDSKANLAIAINWIKPKIVISVKVIKKLSTKELEAVILHEFYHLKRKHPFLLIVSEVASSSLVFLPLLKDLTKKMRTVLEQEADAFVVKSQKTEKYLNLALAQITSRNRFNIYPAFSKREEYRFGKINTIFSLLVVLLGLFLFKLPIESNATGVVDVFSLSNCGEYQCSTHCFTTASDDVYQNMSYAFQTALSAFKSID